MMVAGVVGAGMVGKYIEQTLNYSLVFKAMFFLAVIQGVGFPLVLIAG
jgi:hypothetical protein